VVAALAAELAAAPPDLVVVSGDLTMRARRSEYRAARAFFDRLGAPVLAVPGNHDITPFFLHERFLDPYARWREAIAIETEPAWSNQQVAVIGLNTARRLGDHLDWSRGRVTRTRLDRLARRLAAVPADLLRIVVAHHPLLPPEAGPRVTVVGGAARALEMLARHRVRLVLAGHLHRGYMRRASTGHGATLIVQGSTATSVRLRGEPNAYHRVRIGPDNEPVITTRVWNGAAWTTQAAPDAIGKEAVSVTVDAETTGDNPYEKMIIGE
jgi:3',5'-cyclic AMP phosphodiesterase CpdA